MSEFLVPIIVMRPKKYLLSQGKHTGERFVVHFNYLESRFSSEVRSALHKENFKLGESPISGRTVKSTSAVQRRLGFDLCSADHFMRRFE